MLKFPCNSHSILVKIKKQKYKKNIIYVINNNNCNYDF